MLSKSSYLKSLQCPRYLWLWEHRREEMKTPLDMGSEWMIEEGRMVEESARTLFPTGKLVKSFHERGAEQTRAFIDDGHHCLFQATALGDDLLAMADVLQFNPSREVWDIFEVKSTTQVKDGHLHDVGFQKLAFERAGYKIGNSAVIHINRDYVRNGDLDVSAFLTIEDVSAPVSEIADTVEAGTILAKKILALTEEPSLTDFPCCCSPKDCPCSLHCFPGLPPQSVFYLRGITTKKARSLYESGIRTIVGIPDGTRLNKTQEKQVLAAKQGAPIIDLEAIKKTLGSLTYPLYFFDYETFSSAIPPFENFKPGQVMPFQYSLHILRSPDGELEHLEHLAPAYGNTIPDLVAALRTHIGDDGTVIVWNKSFEMGCNDEMGILCPTDAPFLKAVNDRIFDLMEIFTKQYYVDARFNSSCSIKKVLPVLVPALSHKDLEISEGMAASLSWYRMFGPEKSAGEREKTRQNLLEYCKLDTFAMVEIFRYLMKL